MSRKKAREIAMKLVYELDFHPDTGEEVIEWRISEDAFSLISDEDRLYRYFPDDKQREYITSVARGVYSHLPEIDGYIEKYSISWKQNRISRIANAILRLSLFELLYLSDEVPESSSINEAVELAKKYGSEETASFVNGILGAFYRAERGTQ
jgi:N utilization substance protein B